MQFSPHFHTNKTKINKHLSTSLHYSSYSTKFSNDLLTLVQDSKRIYWDKTIPYGIKHERTRL